MCIFKRVEEADGVALTERKNKPIIIINGRILTNALSRHSYSFPWLNNLVFTMPTLQLILKNWMCLFSMWQVISYSELGASFFFSSAVKLNGFYGQISFAFILNDLLTILGIRYLDDDCMVRRIRYSIVLLYGPRLTTILIISLNT